jgi:hypothetical protein
MIMHSSRANKSKLIPMPACPLTGKTVAEMAKNKTPMGIVKNGNGAIFDYAELEKYNPGLHLVRLQFDIAELVVKAALIIQEFNALQAPLIPTQDLLTATTIISTGTQLLAQIQNVEQQQAQLLILKAYKNYKERQQRMEIRKQTLDIVTQIKQLKDQIKHFEAQCSAATQLY